MIALLKFQNFWALKFPFKLNKKFFIESQSSLNQLIYLFGKWIILVWNLGEKNLSHILRLRVLLKYVIFLDITFTSIIMLVLLGYFWNWPQISICRTNSYFTIYMTASANVSFDILSAADQSEKVFQKYLQTNE